MPKAISLRATQTTIAQGQTAANTSFIWEGRAGSSPRNVKPFDLETRRTVDRESAEKAVAFMERSVRDTKPFFLRGAGKPFTAELTRKLWLESPTTLVVEVTRAGVLGGPASTTRSVYRKG